MKKALNTYYNAPKSLEDVGNIEEIYKHVLESESFVPSEQVFASLTELILSDCKDYNLIDDLLVFFIYFSGHISGPFRPQDWFGYVISTTNQSRSPVAAIAEINVLVYKSHCLSYISMNNRDKIS